MQLQTTQNDKRNHIFLKYLTIRYYYLHNTYIYD